MRHWADWVRRNDDSWGKREVKGALVHVIYGGGSIQYTSSGDGFRYFNLLLLSCSFRRLGTV